MIPSQNVPVQTSQNNFQTFQQPQMAAQQMQANPSVPFPSNLQDAFKPPPFYQLHQADVFMANQQYNPNIISPRNPGPAFVQTPCTFPSAVQSQPPSYASLPQNILDQIRNCVSSAAPIFILPAGCHQSGNQQQSSPTNQGGASQPTALNCPQSIYCPPSFYPYPIPMPVFDPSGARSRGDSGARVCACWQKRQECLDGKDCPASRCCCNVNEPEVHRCTATNDDTICAKRNCPASISLQALASQFLSVPGIISCAATRLILRKVAGSNITSTMEDTMEKAQKAIGALTKDQLLAESRNAQQVNALINLHMTTNPPANIIPLMTLLQLKVNVLKAQVESLINKKVMECQGYGFEVETSGPIDPTALTMKTSAELRQLLTALRQKECDERVNVNFSPYHSQRVIAEARLSTVQAKIRQVETEFDRRRCVSVPVPTLTSQVIRRFSESRCTFGYGHANLFEPYVQGSYLESPDPFAPSIRNPRKLYLKPREPRQEELWPARDQDKGVGTSANTDTGTGDGSVNNTKDTAVESRPSADNCSCVDTSSEESLGGDKKKLRRRIDKRGTVRICSGDCLRDASLPRLTPNAVTRIDGVSRGTRTTKEMTTDKMEGEEIGARKPRETVDGKKSEETVDRRRSKDPEDRRGSKGRKSEEEEKWKNGDEGGRRASETEPKDIEEVDADKYLSEEPVSTRVKEEEDDDEDDEDDEDQDEDTEDETIPRVRIKSEPVSDADLAERQGATEKLEDRNEIGTPDSAKVKIERVSQDEPRDDEFVEEEISDDVIIVRKKAIAIDIVTPEQSEMELPIEAVDQERKVDNEVREDGESSIAVTRFGEAKIESAKDTDGLKEESTGEELISKSQEIGRGASARKQTSREPNSSALPENTFAIELQQQDNERDSKEEIRSDNGEPRKKSKARRNVQIVSMMTRVKYHKKFGDLREWNANDYGISLSDAKGEDRCEKETLDATNENDDHFVSKLRDISAMPSDRQWSGEANDSSCKMFPKNREINDEKTGNGIRRFPPLKRVSPEITEAASISGNIFHRSGIECSCSRTVRDRSISCHSDSETWNGVASAIYSVIENQFVSVSSFLAGMPNLQTVLPNFHFNKLPHDTTGNPRSLEQQTLQRSRNKNVISLKDDWIFLPSNTHVRDDNDDDDDDDDDGNGHDTAVENIISLRERCSNSLRKIKHSIIEDKERNKYLLIRGSSSVQLRELLRFGFTRPRRTRRSLLIRSRLKSSANSRHEYSRPFTILRLPKRNGTRPSRANRHVDHGLGTRETFVPLPEIPEDAETSGTRIDTERAGRSDSCSDKKG